MSLWCWSWRFSLTLSLFLLQPCCAEELGHHPSSQAEEEKEGILYVLQPLWEVQSGQQLPLHPRSREGGRLHQVGMDTGIVVNWDSEWLWCFLMGYS